MLPRNPAYDRQTPKETILLPLDFAMFGFYFKHHAMSLNTKPTPRMTNQRSAKVPEELHQTTTETTPGLQVNKFPSSSNSFVAFYYASFVSKSFYRLHMDMFRYLQICIPFGENIGHFYFEYLLHIFKHTHLHNFTHNE